ncbi:MAG: tetratricopeptide repeat protein [Acidobacteria bacterium]|nr:tetratricopeptide repeat protein [Acidobacteriota bacterium]
MNRNTVVDLARGTAAKAILALVLICGVAGSMRVSARNKLPVSKPKMQAAAVGGAARYDAGLYAKASDALKAGRLDEAVDGYCSMFPRTDGGFAAWSVSVSLVCDPAAVEPLVSSLRKLQGDPVFVLKRIYRGTPCYRVCFSLSADRRGAAAQMRAIRKEFLRYKPFPFQMDGLCPSSEAPMAVAAVGQTVAAGGALPQAEKPPAQAPSGPVRYLGPPVSENGTPAASVDSAGPLLSTLKAGAGKDAANYQEPSGDAQAWFQKGVAAYGRGDRQEARRCYEKSLELSPNKPETLNNLGILYLEENKFTEAKSLLERAVDISPSYSRAHLNLAGALWGLGERDKAVEQARAAKDLETSNVQAHLTLASFLIAMGKYEEGGMEARLALALEPGNARAQALSREAEEQGGHGEAKKDKVEG